MAASNKISKEEWDLIMSGKSKPLKRAEVIDVSTLGKTAEKDNKFNARKVTIDGVKFDSQHEADYACKLKMLQAKGEISDLQFHVKYEIIPKLKINGVTFSGKHYIADFVFKDKDGNTHVQDTKSTATVTQLFKYKKHLMAEKYGIIVEEIF